MENEFSFDLEPLKSRSKKNKKPAEIVLTQALIPKTEKKVVQKTVPHVRRTKVTRVVKVLAGEVKVTFKRIHGGVVASMRGAPTITVTAKVSKNENQQFRALVEYSSINTGIYFGATERQAYKRAAAVAWN